MIVTANQYFGLAPKPIPTWDAWKRIFLLRHMLRNGIRERDISDSPALPAYVGTGKWRVLCSNPECPGTEFVWEEGLMMCASCFNAHVNHQYLKTEFPSNRLDIERILDFRTAPSRNWIPSETLADLEAENLAHSLEVR